MSVPIEFVPARSESQLVTVAALARDIWYEYYVPLIGRPQVDYMVSNFQSLAAMLAQIRDGYEYFLVRREDREIGYCALQPQGQHLFLSKLYVHSAARGRGTGRACMEFIEQLGRDRGLTLVWLTVNKGNPAVNAYKRLGFRVTSALVTDIGGGFVMDDFRMEKVLA